MSIDISRTLFVGDLSVFCTENELRQLFAPFGFIDDIRLKKTTANATRLGYGFIQFGTKECAERAMNSLNGIMFNGRIMRINWAVPKSATKMLVIKPPKKVEAAQVHVSFISRQIDEIVTEATLRNLFNLYGEVIDVTFKKLQIDQNQKVQHGYGFVHYPLTKEGVSAALIAVKAFHQVTIDKVTYDCSMSSVLEDFLGLPQGSKQQQQPQQEAVQPPQPPKPQPAPMQQQMNSNFPSAYFSSQAQQQSFPYQQYQPQQQQQSQVSHNLHQLSQQLPAPQWQQQQHQQQQLTESFFPMLSKASMNNNSFYSQVSGQSSYCNSYQTSANNSFYVPNERPPSLKSIDNLDTINANASFHMAKTSGQLSSAGHTPMSTMSNQLFSSYSSSVSDCSNDSFLTNANEIWDSSFNSHTSVRDFLLSEE